MSDALPLKVLAHAKVNLSLSVLRKRDDGFHEVRTRMALVDLADELTFTKETAGGVRFTCNDPVLPADETNLVVKAVRALEKRRRKKFNVRIHLEKRVPAAAGFGGGSSDAAATLKGINELFALGLNREKLRKHAAEIGSDVAFFLYDSVCDCTGRGELAEPVSYKPTLPLLLIKPKFGVPTPEAYQNWQTSQEIPGVLYSPQIGYWGTLENDLERPVFQKYLVLADLKMWLLRQPEVHAALMSGSGSAMFAVLREIRFADQLAQRVRREFGETTWTHVGVTLAS